MEATLIYRGFTGIMENKLETTIVHCGSRDSGKYNGNCYSISPPHNNKTPPHPPSSKTCQCHLLGNILLVGGCGVVIAETSLAPQPQKSTHE